MEKTKVLAAFKKLNVLLGEAPELDQHFTAIKNYINNIEAINPVVSDMPKIPQEVKELDKSIVLFSDGACRGNPGPGSWAFVAQVKDDEYSHEAAGVSELTTNNKMEMSGVIKALEYAANQKSRPHIYMYTDSKYVVDGLNSWVEGWKRRGWKKADNKAPENLELWQRLDELNQSLNITIKWVKGHAGHTQNERCDKLANEALDEAGF